MSDGAAGHGDGDAGGPSERRDDARIDTSDAPAASASDALDAPADAAIACSPACRADEACIAGVCWPAPVVLARAPGCGAARLALAGAEVVWTEQATGAVKALAVASPGGAPKTLAAGQLSPGPIAADDEAVYWSNAGDLTIRTAPLGGSSSDGGADGGSSVDGGASDGGASPFLTVPAVVDGILASGGFVYYTSGASTLRVPRAGGAPLTLATFATCKTTLPFALAQGGGYVYQTDKLSQFITREHDDGTQLVANPCAAADAGPTPQIAAPETITHSQGELYLDAIAVAGGEVVWADRATIYAKVPGATSGREVATSAGSNPLTGFVVTGESVYFGERMGDPGTAPAATDDTIQVALLGSPDAGGDTPAGQVVALGQPGASSFAADATHVYWTTHTPSATAGAPDDCAIVSVAK